MLAAQEEAPSKDGAFFLHTRGHQSYTVYNSVPAMLAKRLILHSSILLFLVSPVVIRAQSARTCPPQQIHPAGELLVQFSRWSARYRLGPVGVYKADTQIYFRFRPTGVDNVIETEPFVLQSDDTLAAYRFAIMEELGREHLLKPGVPVSEQTRRAEAGHEFDYVPDDSIFPPNAVMNFILELRRAGTGLVLWSGDTLQVFRDNEGALRYRNLPEGWSRVEMRPTNGQVGNVFVSARLESHLPASTDLEYTLRASKGFTYWNHILRTTGSFQVAPPIRPRPKQ
jgi:hypothetical protein